MTGGPKVDHPQHFDGNLDQWVQAADNLEKSLQKLKDIKDKAKIKPEPEKPEPEEPKSPKSEPKLKSKPEDDDVNDDVDDEEDEDTDTSEPKDRADGRNHAKPKASR